VGRTSLPELAVSNSPSGPGSAAQRSAAANLIISIRPGEWTKNLFVFAGLLFGQRLTDAVAVKRAGLAFLIFCALAGVVYLVNDVADRDRDRQHPRKRNRPIASGALGVPTALGAATVLTAGGLAAAWWLGRDFFAVAAGYLLLLVLYSGPLKHIVIIDVLTIAIGFVLRVAAGAVAIGVPISQWLLICTILLALFLGLSKRRHEIVLLADGAIGHRRILEEYSPYLLDQMIGVVTASTLMAYMLYATSHETADRFGTSLLGLTIPFPLYGIFRYLYLVHRKEGGGSPAELLLNDRPLLACVALWAVGVAVIIYRPFGI
jgi:4-hydroxybenzoate polyprenyltransferase